MIGLAISKPDTTVPITDNNTFALSKMEAVAQGLQVPYDSKSLKLVSRKGC